jgi:hypothetical protein
MNGPEDEGINEDEGRHAEHDHDHGLREDTMMRGKIRLLGLSQGNIFRVAFLTAFFARKATPQYSARHFTYRYY